VDIRDIYTKVAADLGMSVDRLKEQIINNYMMLFMKNHML